MAEFKMPELNSVIVAGNLTKDPVFRQTTNGTPVVNFSIASNRRFRDKNDDWKEDVCYVGVVAWNRLAESCRDKLKKGNAVLVDGELQSRTFKTEDSTNRTIVEIKARRIQFLNRKASGPDGDKDEPSTFTDDNFDSLLSPEDSNLIHDDK
jgi:single-strand DNA-binding protein